MGRLFKKDEIDLAPGTEEVVHELEHDERTRTCLVHVPELVRDRRDVPLMLNFHGGMSRATLQARQSRMTAVAEREGFLVAYPSGTGRFPRALTWNAGTCCGYAIENDIDDVGFVEALINLLVEKHSVDPRRVYACGMSNGGMLAYRLALELPDRIAGIGAVAATMNVPPREVKRPVPVIHFHGMGDENVRFEGGVGDNQVTKRPHSPVPDAVAFWTRANGCRAEPDVTTTDDAVIERYAPEGDAGAPYVLYKLREGGHTWPGGVDVTARWNTGPMIESVDASGLIWSFLKGFSTPS